MNLERLELRSDDTAKSNLHKLAELFPSCIVECRSADDACKTELALDLDKLQALVGRSISSGSDSGAGVGAGTGSGRERYEFTWVGKDQARLEALRPIARTLLPVTERSVDFATTQNLYVEGDNLEALKLLQRSYSGAVKMIYVDPPYNTGTDFVYRDDFALSAKDYDALSGAVDDKGQRYFRNSDTSGRYHSAWCSMMYSRLLLARSFLTRDGVIFISIDDHEVHNLRKICDEIFGERNFMAELIWQRAYSPKNDAKGVSQSHDYVLMYVRDISVFKIGRLPRNEKVNRRYQNKDNDPRGVWKSSDLSVKTYSKANDYEVTLPSGRKVRPPAGRCWSVSAREYERLVADNRIYFGNKGDSSPSLKRFLSELKTDGLAPTSLLFYSDVGHSQEGAQELKALMNAGVFDGPKPTRLIRHLMCLANLNPQGGDIVMDFFSGSASTADAVLQQNLEDGGNRRFIMVQYPESVDTESTAAQAGFTTICEIGEERIRRAAAALSAKAKQCTKIVHGGGGVSTISVQTNAILTPQFSTDAPSELGAAAADVSSASLGLDFGFRVFTIADTNDLGVNMPVSDYSQDMLQQLERSLRPERRGEELLFGCVLAYGLPLTWECKSEQIAGCTLLSYGDNALVACFDSEINRELILEIARREPLRVVFADQSFESSMEKVNLIEQLMTLCPSLKDEIKVI